MNVSVDRDIARYAAEPRDLREESDVWLEQDRMAGSAMKTLEPNFVRLCLCLCLRQSSRTWPPSPFRQVLRETLGAYGSRLASPKSIPEPSPRGADPIR